MQINIKVEGIKQLQQKLKVTVNKFLNMRQFWSSVGSYVQRQTIRERFNKEQSPDGQKWKPLAPSTIQHRKKRHKKGNMKILQDTGELRRSVTYEADSSFVKVGSKLKYARIHQFGGTVNVNRVGQYRYDHKNHKFKRRGNSYSYSHKVTIPARPFLGVNDAEKQHITSMFKQYLKRNILGSG
ncbi:MAG: phage virion morphogenesis protein [Synergistaceae bacterium]|nr:phage virion morphogenesis protein [Synergistaceae bacterium]